MRRKADEETAKLSQVVQCVSGLPPPSRCQLSDYQLLGLPLPLQVPGASYQVGSISSSLHVLGSTSRDWWDMTTSEVLLNSNT